MAEALARLTRQVYTKEFFQMGLLHNSGQYPMMFFLGQDYVKLIQEAESMTYPLYALERDRLGYSHVEVSVEIAWALNWSDETRRLLENLYEAPKDEESWSTRELRLREFVSYAKSMYGGQRSDPKNCFQNFGLQENTPEILKTFSIEQLRRLGTEVESRVKEEFRQRGFLSR
jgi:HD-like signal output (HDOD) protein